MENETKATLTLDEKEALQEQINELEKELVSVMQKNKSLAMLLKTQSINIQETNAFDGVYIGDNSYVIGEFIESISEILKAYSELTKKLLDDRANRI